jgi:hypothetical protein
LVTQDHFLHTRHGNLNTKTNCPGHNDKPDTSITPEYRGLPDRKDNQELEILNIGTVDNEHTQLKKRDLYCDLSIQGRLRSSTPIPAAEDRERAGAMPVTASLY